MTDENGNGRNGLWHELTETRDRALAWAARALLLAVSGSAAVSLWLAKEQLADLKQVNNLALQQIERVSEDERADALGIARLDEKARDDESRLGALETARRH